MSSVDGVPNESRVTQILLGIILPTVISSIFVLARLYTRSIITRNWGWDDTFLTIALVTSIGLAVTNSLLVKFGVGHHQVFLALSQIVPIIKLAFISRIVYQFVLCMTKIGICIFYLRVFQDQRSTQWVYLIISFVVITAIINELTFVFLCKPVSDAWSLSKPNCRSTIPATDANAICNILADIFLMIFAFPRVLALQMNLRRKTSLLVVVSLGVLVIAASIIRTVLVVSLNTDPDLTWNGYDITTWTTLEVSTGLFCASAPCIRPLIRQITPGFLSSNASPPHTSTSKLSKCRGYGNSTLPAGGVISLSTILPSRRNDRTAAFALRSEEDVERGSNFLTSTSAKTWDGVGIGAERDYTRSADEAAVNSTEGRSQSGKHILRTRKFSIVVEDGSGSVRPQGGVELQNEVCSTVGDNIIHGSDLVDEVVLARESFLSSDSESERSQYLNRTGHE